MVFISKRNRRREREVQQALNNRLELVKEGFTRRDLIKMGLMTSTGVLIAKGVLTHARGAATEAAVVMETTATWGAAHSRPRCSLIPCRFLLNFPLVHCQIRG